MSCKECLHYEACKHYSNIWFMHNGDKLEPYPEAEAVCKCYTDKSRFVELPCKIGDVVWANRHFHGCLLPQEGTISEMYFTQDMKLQILVKYVGRGIWGKTVFPTREAAEEAIKEKKNV